MACFHLDKNEAVRREIGADTGVARSAVVADSFIPRCVYFCLDKKGRKKGPPKCLVLDQI